MKYQDKQKKNLEKRAAQQGKTVEQLDEDYDSDDNLLKYSIIRNPQ
jgi:hypothetical protein